ncbi:MAG TPA: alpha/beta fold hydrolase, partial [Ohtaekwangia sp.]|uniref:alpha/beta hydrolase family protein n=1 Tax=Ohtaekwangia sp. TaxID=2066019 RepID=UPI002F92BBA7
MKEVLTVVARDGIHLSATCFIAKHPHERVVLINSATGVKQQFYSDFAKWLANEGFHVYTFDYRGIGNSRPENLKDVLYDMHDWSADVDAMISYISHEHPHARLIIAGHSIGGQLIGMANLSHQADAFVMIGSQTPYWKNYPGFIMKLKLLLFWYILIPVLTRLFGYFPTSRFNLFEDLPEEVARQWSRWARNRNYIFDELPAEQKSFEALRQRTLVISFADDTLAPPAAVQDLNRFYKNLKREHWHLHPDDVMKKSVGHFGFFRKQMEAVLWRETAQWLLKDFS